MNAHRVRSRMTLASMAATTAMASESSASVDLAVFTLVRGGPNESDLETFVNSRQCLDKVMPPSIAYDNIAFHEGNVPLAVQQALRRRV